ncbi:hypothetical protein [Falsiroseomonas sp.]|uniref:hypothetical protein n=1 Tax=Falsiroseomonas sp. TaxID=2870721 RepID=UPI002737703F|nr:hypothetical protein [Falsiroseomonas sp.]MDP3417681.1 hypothetical protein [Falsiroseomonas sp.]
MENVLTVSSRIEPGRITKPLQLLGAWLAGLVSVNGAFLFAATHVTQPSWGAGALIIASIANVPIFLVCLFLLQTRFRPEMQEDTYYAEYLTRRFVAETGKSEYVKVVSRQPSAEILRPLASSRTPPLSVNEELNPQRAQPDYSIEINDLLEKYDGIVAGLKAIRLFPTSTFGTTSTDPYTPAVFELSVGHGFPVRVFQKIFAICVEHGLETVNFTVEDHAARHVYIGAYGYDDPTEHHIRVTDHIKKKILAENLSSRGLKSILVGNANSAKDPGSSDE